MNNLNVLGGKTIMNQKGKKNVKYILSHPNNDACLYKLTKRYLKFLGNHNGSLQPNCQPGNPKKPHATRSIIYTLALADLRQVRIDWLLIIYDLVFTNNFR